MENPTVIDEALSFYTNGRINTIPLLSSVHVSTPREIFWRTKLDFHKHLALDFGDYSEEFNSSSADSSLNSRTVHCIVLYPSGNAQGSWKFYSIETG